VGAVPGVAATANGLDNAWAGLKTIWTGEGQDTYAQQATGAGVERLTGSKTAAAIAETTVGILGPKGIIGLGQATGRVGRKLLEQTAERLAATKAAEQVAAEAAEVAGREAGEKASQVSGTIAVPNNTASRDHRTVDRVLSIKKGSRPDPTTYLSQDYIETHLSRFADGVTKFSSKTPTGIVGPPGGTFVIPGSLADTIVVQSGDDVGKLEQLLSLDPGVLGTSPVRIDIPSPGGLRLPSGNELGANNQFLPGAYMAGRIPEATINPAPPGTYSVAPVFSK
jgi:hypothetical protein